MKRVILVNLCAEFLCTFFLFNDLTLIQVIATEV